jgi:hypothetical protein
MKMNRPPGFRTRAIPRTKRGSSCCRMCPKAPKETAKSNSEAKASQGHRRGRTLAAPCRAWARDIRHAPAEIDADDALVPQQRSSPASKGPRECRYTPPASRSGCAVWKGVYSNFGASQSLPRCVEDSACTASSRKVGPLMGPFSSALAGVAVYARPRAHCRCKVSFGYPLRLCANCEPSAVWTRRDPGTGARPASPPVFA